MPVLTDLSSISALPKADGARMYRLALLWDEPTAGSEPPNYIDADPKRAQGVCLTPEWARTADDHSRSHHRTPGHHRVPDQATPVNTLSLGGFNPLQGR